MSTKASVFERIDIGSMVWSSLCVLGVLATLILSFSANIIPDRKVIGVLTCEACTFVSFIYLFRSLRLQNIGPIVNVIVGGTGIFCYLLGQGTIFYSLWHKQEMPWMLVFGCLYMCIVCAGLFLLHVYGKEYAQERAKLNHLRSTENV